MRPGGGRGRGEGRQVDPAEGDGLSTEVRGDDSEGSLRNEWDKVGQRVACVTMLTMLRLPSALDVGVSAGRRPAAAGVAAGPWQEAREERPI